MLALSVRQPWAWAILNGKDVENREWQPHNPNRRFRGRILLHASKGCTHNEFDGALDFMYDIGVRLHVPRLEEIPRGAIVGAVTITGWVDEHASPWFVGPGALTLERAVALPEPVPCKGAQGFFRVPADVAMAVKRLADTMAVRE